MGIHWNCLAADKSSQTLVGDLDSDSDSDSPRDSIVQMIHGDESLVDSGDYSCCFTMVTFCISTWMSVAPLSGVGNQIPVSLDDSKLRAFTMAELRAATFKFSENMVLGRGGFGKVYKGWLKEQLPSKGTKNRQIAVKRLDLTSSQGRQEFLTEITILERLSHPNIITLLGFCRENKEHILVYEYMKKNTLNHCLFKKKTDRVISWEIRLKIAIQMAEGLSYLHSFEEPIIVRDFKSSNILLDKVCFVTGIL